MTLQYILTSTSPQQTIARRSMVDGQIRTFDVTDRDVIDQFYGVPRERFIDADLATLAYSDSALQLSNYPRQLLPPMILARMIEAAQIKSTDRVLDVGGGYGYSAAIMAGLAAHVVVLECSAEASTIAKAALEATDIFNVTCVTGPLVAGFASGGPYDVILLNGAFAAQPTILLEQLASHGRLVAVRLNGTNNGQALVIQNDQNKLGERCLFNCGTSVLEGFASKPTFVF